MNLLKLWATLLCRFNFLSQIVVMTLGGNSAGPQSSRSFQQLDPMLRRSGLKVRITMFMLSARGKSQMLSFPSRSGIQRDLSRCV
jgi:hypothetical protein